MDGRFWHVMLLVLMIIHVVYFKYEINEALDLKNFKGLNLDEDIGIMMKEFINQVIILSEISIEIAINKFNFIKDKLLGYNYNPIGMLSSPFIFKDTEEKDTEEEDDEEAAQAWIEFIKNNILALIASTVITVFTMYVVGRIISQVISGGIIVLITAIPKLIVYLLAILVIIILVSAFLLLLSNNNIEIIRCAEGLDASGNRMDTENMEVYERRKMELCRLFINIMKPETIYFPTTKKDKDIRITQVIKQGSGDVIKVILPGNVSYIVKKRSSLPENDNEAWPDKKDRGRIIYILDESANKLKKNVKIFKKFEDDIYEPKEVFKAFEEDYKNNMMMYYGWSNVYYFLIVPFAVMAMVGVFSTIRALMTPPPNSSPDEIQQSGQALEYGMAVAVGIIILIIKLIIGMGTTQHITGLVGHLDYITDKSEMNRVLLLILEIIIYIMSTGVVFREALTNITDYKVLSYGIAAIFIFLIIAVNIMIGEQIRCDLLGVDICKTTFLTDYEREKTCNIQDDMTAQPSPEPSLQGTPPPSDQFMNFSNNHIKNIGYARFKESFTEEGSTEVVNDLDNITHRCNIPVIPEMWFLEIHRQSTKIFSDLFAGKMLNADQLIFTKESAKAMSIMSILILFANECSLLGINKNIPDTGFPGPGPAVQEIFAILKWIQPMSTAILVAVYITIMAEDMIPTKKIILPAISDFSLQWVLYSLTMIKCITT